MRLPSYGTANDLVHVVIEYITEKTRCMSLVSRPRPGRKRGFLPGLFPHYGCSIGFFLAQSLSSMNPTILAQIVSAVMGAVAIPSGLKFTYITVFSGAI